MALTSYQHTADYTLIDQALRARWHPFIALEAEMLAFAPKPASDFKTQRDAELERLRVLNPEADVNKLRQLVDSQFTYHSSHEAQFRAAFAKRIESEYVTVIMLAHALSEALINAILAIGLASVEAPEVFEMVERADFRQKWLYGPKSFFPAYNFPMGGALQESLNMLIRQRNALVHLKIELQIGDRKILEGTSLERHSYDDMIRWTRRFFSLPYDLVDLARREIKEPQVMLLFDRRPIEVAVVHNGK